MNSQKENTYRITHRKNFFNFQETEHDQIHDNPPGHIA